MQYSYSRVEVYDQCPYRYRLRYIDGLKEMDKYDPQDPLIVGTAFHRCIEESVPDAIAWYYAQYPIITDLHVEEAMKLEVIGEKARAMLDLGRCEFEVKVQTPDYLGFIDCLRPMPDGSWCIVDFKYSSSPDRYRDSKQIGVYAHYARLMGYDVQSGFFLVAPKIRIRRKKGEMDEDFRLRLREEMAKPDYRPTLVPARMDGWEDFRDGILRIENERLWPKRPGKLCPWCPYQRYCESDGQDMIDVAL